MAIGVVFIIVFRIQHILTPSCFLQFSLEKEAGDFQIGYTFLGPVKTRRRLKNWLDTISELAVLSAEDLEMRRLRHLLSLLQELPARDLFLDRHDHFAFRVGLGGRILSAGLHVLLPPNLLLLRPLQRAISLLAILYQHDGSRVAALDYVGSVLASPEDLAPLRRLWLPAGSPAFGAIGLAALLRDGRPLGVVGQRQQGLHGLL